MINITDKKDCVGCNACVQRCPKHCIDMIEDEQGFLYPKVNIGLCIDCGLCEKVCPVIHQAQPRKPIFTYAAKNKDEEIQRNSSSGGIFSALANKVIAEGGVVFGARFDTTWEVIHDYTETTEGIRAFQTSKYVQSRIADTFRQAEIFLKEGRKVLFSGTPCQLAGLRLFLRKEYDNLIAVDVVCHGVPSPLVWREYLKYITRPKGAGVGKNSDYQSTLNPINTPVITGINFRDKRLGWEKYGFSVHAVVRKGDKNTDSQSIFINPEKEFQLLFEPHKTNLYMQAFLNDLDLRPSCYACPAKCGKSHSDITLADFWGIRNTMPSFYDTNAVSLVITYSGKGERGLDDAQIIKTNATYESAVVGNPAIERSASKPHFYHRFWVLFNENGISGMFKVLQKMKPSLFQRTINLHKRAIKKFLRLFHPAVW